MLLLAVDLLISLLLLLDVLPGELLKEFKSNFMPRNVGGASEFVTVEFDECDDVELSVVGESPSIPPTGENGEEGEFEFDDKFDVTTICLTSDGAVGW
ncbi:unnamed protein product [Ambrosiozyma monospora]|uniref:Unnamed protein product n=1 Tax=Ambrosiozyma monospora TaxID=43982 RepID=A0ACB5U962_AMBMO|nr:unnamed protein product [Ambrosiozyma monospora]